MQTHHLECGGRGIEESGWQGAWHAAKMINSLRERPKGHLRLMPKDVSNLAYACHDMLQ